MNEQEIQQLIAYWQKTAKRDYGTMKALFESKRYPESLFFGHIVLEKILKALTVKETKKHAPYFHDLTRLAELAKLELAEKDKQILDSANNYNIKARYPDFKLKFYQLYKKENTQKIINEITNLYKKLCKIFDKLKK